MSAESEFAHVLGSFASDLRKVYEKNFGPVVENEEIVRRIAQRCVILGPSFRRKEPAAPSGPLIAKFDRIGDASRRYYSQGEVVAFPDTPDLAALKVEEQTYYRLDRDAGLLKAWSRPVYDPSRISGLDPEDEPCPMAQVLIAHAITALGTNAMKESPGAVLDLFPRILKVRRSNTPYLILAKNMSGHTLKATGSADGDPPRIETDAWWGVLQSMRKEARWWRIGYTRLTDFRAGQHRGVAAITDGLQLAAGFVS